MSPAQVIDHFGPRITDVSKAIGYSRTSIYKWKHKGKVPAETQLKLNRLSEGKLKVDRKFRPL